MFCLELHMEFDMRTQVHMRKSPSWDYIFWLQEILTGRTGALQGNSG